MTIPRAQRNFRRQRLGGVSLLMAVILPMLAILAAFAINSAHMQMVRTEMVIATDAAARSAGRTFSEEQTVEDAIDAAKATAALNNVNGAPLHLNEASSALEIEFGTSSQENNMGRFNFTRIPNGQVSGNELIVSAIRINAKRNANSIDGPVELIFPTLLSRSTFSPEFSSTAMQVDRDISLVLDRSGSMAWPTYEWPEGFNEWGNEALDAALDAGVLFENRGRLYYSRGQDQWSYYQFLYEDYLELGNRPATPFEQLIDAVDAFLNVLDETPQNELVSVASYSNNGNLDLYLTEDYDEVRETLNTLVTGGGTGIGNGMKEGDKAFTHSNSRPFASKTMVVMTDGNHNSGTAPDVIAEQLMSSSNLSIQTVTFGGGANQDAMREVAEIGQGKHYHADSGTELVEAFEEIANNLPTILTK